MANTLKFGTDGNWATKKGSTLSYNDEGGNYKPLPFTTTRNSIATRVNKEGLIEVVGNDVPRIDYTDSADGALLLENSATNLVTYSSYLSVLSKVSVGTASNPVTTANYALAPDGTMTATRVVFDLNGGTTNQDRSILRQSISSGDYYLSIYVKSTDGTEQKVMWHDGSEFDVTTVTNEWKRITYDSRNGISNVGIALTGESGVDTSDILVWGFQAETGNVSSYIPTSGSTVTRVADTASGAGNSEVFNDSQGVLFLNINTSDTSVVPVISLSDGSFSNEIEFAYFGTNQWNVVMRVGGTNTFVIGTVNGDAYSKFSVSYTSSNFKVFLNGFLIASNPMASALSGLEEIDFSLPSATNPFYGKTKEIGYYDTALTDEELETLTSYRSLNELVTELNLNEL